MGFSHSLSAAEQQSILSTARFAVVRFTNSFTDRIGNRYFFTKEDIDDMVQDVAMKVWRALDRYDPSRAKLSTWVGCIAVNCVKDAVDYRMKRLGISESLFTRNAGDDKDIDATEVYDGCCGFIPEVWSLTSGYGADKEVERKESELDVWRKAHLLGEKNERVVRLLAGGFTPKEIAAVEGWTYNATATRICRIRRALKEALADVDSAFGFHYPNLAS